MTGPQPSSDPVLAGVPPLPFDTKATFAQIYNTLKDWVDIEETPGEYGFMCDVPSFSKPGPAWEVAPELLLPERAPPTGWSRQWGWLRLGPCLSSSSHLLPPHVPQEVDLS